MQPFTSIPLSSIYLGKCRYMQRYMYFLIYFGRVDLLLFKTGSLTVYSSWMIYSHPPASAFQEQVLGLQMCANMLSKYVFIRKVIT